MPRRKDNWIIFEITCAPQDTLEGVTSQFAPATSSDTNISSQTFNLQFFCVTYHQQLISDLLLPPP